jgi:urease accessory protein
MPPQCGISSHPFPHLILLCSSIILAFFQSAMSVAASTLTETRVPDSVAASGLGQLEFVRTGSRTIVTRVFATSPLRLLNPGNNGRAAWVYSSSYGGGLVDGDRVALDISASRGAEAYLSTQASTKVYRSPHGTCVDVNARVEEGATLLVLPDPVVCFTGARYRQAQHFHLSAQGSQIACCRGDVPRENDGSSSSTAAS